MKKRKYLVRFHRTEDLEIEVKAENKEEARRLVENFEYNSKNEYHDSCWNGNEIDEVEEVKC